MQHFNVWVCRTVVAGVLLSGGLCGCSVAQEPPTAGVQNVTAGTGGTAKDVSKTPLAPWPDVVVFSPARLNALPAEQRKAWETYIESSKAVHLADKAVLDGEMKAAGLDKPLVPVTAKKGFKLASITDETWFGSQEARNLADVMISFQLPNGGWSKSVAYDQGPRKPGMQWTDQTDPWHYAATFDNRSTTEQLGLLAKVHQATNDPKYSAAFLKGLDYILKAQYPNGGWPQVYPLEGAYHDEVTFNDDAMIHVMELLRGVANGQPQFAFIDDARRAKARDALAAGVRFILQAQYVQDGRRTVWGAQHDPLSLIPAAARRMEPASLSGGESVGIVRFLMDIPNPSPEVVRSIEDALAWFEKSKITGIQETKRDGRLYYAHGTTGTEPYWARFYDMQTNKPLFAGGRDAVVYANYDEMWANNPANYDFYTDKPEKLLTKDQEKWRKMLAKAGKDKAPG